MYIAAAGRISPRTPSIERASMRALSLANVSIAAVCHPSNKIEGFRAV